MANKQTQKGGDGSSQLQVGNLILGIDEKRAREIFDEKLKTALESFTNEALGTAKERNQKFDNSLMKRIVKEEAQSAFSDPAFQLLLIEAQKSAASTEREPDYDLLSELLIHRHKSSKNRNIVAGVSRAVEVVDQVSDEALLGLTAFHSASTFVPRGKNLPKGLEILDKLFLKIIDVDLPEGVEWLDHLDILDAVRTSSFGGLKSLEEFWLEHLKDLCLNGILVDSESYTNALEILEKAKLNTNILVENENSSGYVKIPVSARSQIVNIIMHQNGLDRLATEIEVEALENIFDLYDGTVLTKEKLAQEIDKYASLKKLRLWWNSLSEQSLQITSVGKALAHSNVQRLESNIPPLG
jgi:hypothetical protein